MAELCLGTVQFGMKYGINNTLGQPAEEAVFEMLDTAIENGINVIDTARAYGTAEMILGKYLENRKETDSLRIISKLRPNVVTDGENDVRGVIRREFEDTLRRLRIQRLDGYLLHTPQYIYHEQIVESIRKLKEEHLIEHAGVSIYDLEDGYAALETEGFDYIQLPYSILDQRGMQNDFIWKAKEKGVVIFTRSAFLQGLFMMEKNAVPKHLKHVVPYLDKFDKLLEKYSVNRIAALLHFVKFEKGIDYLVFGVDTKEQLIQDINAFNHDLVPEELIKELKKEFTHIEKSIIFPSLWSNGKKAE